MVPVYYRAMGHAFFSRHWALSVRKPSGLLSDSLRSLVRKSIGLLSDSLRSLVRKPSGLLSDSLRSLVRKPSGLLSDSLRSLVRKSESFSPGWALIPRMQPIFLHFL